MATKKEEPKQKRKSPGQKQISELKEKYSTDTKKEKKKITIPKESENLKQKEILFCEEFLKTNNVTESYLKIKPHVKESTACTEGHKLLKNPLIKKYIEERLKPQQEKEIKKAIADADEILEFITAVIRGEVKDQLGFDTSVKDRLTASKMLADRYRLFDKPETPENQNSDMPEMKITIVDNSDLEKALYDADNTNK